MMARTGFFCPLLDFSLVASGTLTGSLLVRAVRYFRRSRLATTVPDCPSASTSQRGPGSRLTVERRCRMFFCCSDKMRGQSDVKGLAQVEILKRD